MEMSSLVSTVLFFGSTLFVLEISSHFDAAVRDIFTSTLLILLPCLFQLVYRLFIFYEDHQTNQTVCA